MFEALQLLKVQLDYMLRLQSIQAEDLNHAWLRAADLKDKIKDMQALVDEAIRKVEAL